LTCLKKIFSLFLAPLLLTLLLWFLTDATVTYSLGIRGFSSFLITDRTVGHTNKPNFSGRFGGFLDSFSALVSIGPLGERKSTAGSCKDLPFFLFMGDSTTAGFEVNDDETFVSEINRDCKTTHITGANFGVRAYDTHEVIPNYRRISRLVHHDAVLYLITENDLVENTELFPYPNVAKHFGRIFWGTYYLPTTSRSENAYLNFRIFLSDHLYMTTKAAQVIETWHSDQSESRYANGIPADQAETLIKLVETLSSSVKNNGARLYVAAYPCLSAYRCGGPDVEKLLREASDRSKDFVVLPLAIDLDSKFANGEIKREDMRFYNDMHLSKFGHEVLGKELAQMLGELRQPR
jgi:lysophospholipase L1-like esterase